MATSLDAEILHTVKEISPSTAYLVGFNDHAGKLFIPSEANTKAALRKLRALRKKARSETQRKVLDSLEASLLYEEPQPVLDDIIGSIFVHLVKEGLNDEHMLSLLRHSEKALAASRKRFSGRRVPTGVKALTLYRLGGVVEILGTVRGQTKNQGVRRGADAVKAQAEKYVKMFELEGFGKGEFPNVEKVFKKQGFELGREKFYPVALKKGFDYHETPAELERNAVEWLDEELPRFKHVTARLAKNLGCKPVPEEVEKAINARYALDPKKLIATTQGLRKVVQRFVNERVHGINPKYKTTVIETPGYLTGTIPTGAAQFFDTYTKKPFQVFFQTTDPKRDPDKSVPGLLNLLIHEEYGHCVHHSNSVVGFVGKVPTLQLLPGTPVAGPITEGLSFNREIEVFEALKELERRGARTKAEKDYVALMEKYGGLKQVNLELEFMTRRWRVVRFLRVIGDVRINTGKQGLLEFVDWANRRTGVPRSSVYFQLFPAHEGIFPGYATNYAVMGQEIRGMEKKIVDDSKRYKFSTYLCSIGFPPRSVYRKMLAQYAKKLR
ncbi:MAG: hypothetical protein HY296_02280 [Thaumarchaeota archaeon]|nr:hypothetical protein [Nitrososphaerota archaeon]